MCLEDSFISLLSVCPIPEQNISDAGIRKDTKTNKSIFNLCDLCLILGLHPANERRRSKVMPSLIGWAQT